MGFGIRIMPGVRVGVSSRGVRTSLGPRAARVHVGGGRAGISTGIGPFSAYTSLGGSNRRSQGTSRTPSSASYQRSLAAVERAAQRAAREEQISQVIAWEKALVELHLEEFVPPERELAPLPDPVDLDQLAARLAAAAGVSQMKRADKAAAERAARAQVERAASLISAERRRGWSARQHELDAEWNALVSNDPVSVVATLEDAFADNLAAAAPLNCVDGIATVLVLVRSPAQLPQEQAATTPTGNPTLRKRTKSVLSDLHACHIASAMLATAKEALIVAPGLSAVSLLAVQRDAQALLPSKALGAVFAGTFTRDRLATFSWRQIDPLEQLLLTPDALFERKGAARMVANLDLSDEPELAQVLDQLRHDLAHGQDGISS